MKNFGHGLLIKKIRMATVIKKNGNDNGKYHFQSDDKKMCVDIYDKNDKKDTDDWKRSEF